MGNVGGMMEENVFVLSLKIYLSSALFSAVVDTQHLSVRVEGVILKKCVGESLAFSNLP